MISSRVALVTGAANGIGRAISEEFCRSGFSVVLVDRDEKALQQLAEALEPQVTILSFSGDVCDEALPSKVFHAVDQQLGRLDILVNNAARIEDTPVGETAVEAWRGVLEANLTAPFMWSQAAAKRMRARGFGRIINISSHAAHLGTPGRSAYGASKAGLEALTRVMAVELADYGITVNAIAPGAIETERTKLNHSQARRSAWEKAIPLKRYGRLDEVACVVGLLASERSGYLTGETVRVDGGFTIAGLSL